MAVLLEDPAQLLPVAGVRLAACKAGIYKKSRPDIVLLELAEGSTCAAVFTKNAFSAAPVKVARAHLQTASPRYCLINAGNANAGTGERGYSDAVDTCRYLAEQTGCRAEQVMPFSTGVIGEYLPMDNIRNSFSELLPSLHEDNWLNAARAIMTTDTVAKGVSREIMLDNRRIQITGIAKGSGMIRPDMATMLAFIATDAGIHRPILERVLNEAVTGSFNRICVDGDSSTNDACLLMATGQGGVVIENEEDPLLRELQQAINQVCLHLAQAIVRDGEGATKYITVTIEGGTSMEQCRAIAYDIATSPLVKTALFASDPNWGRIVAAIGRSREGELDPEKISVFLNGLCIVRKGERDSAYTENAGKTEMSKAELEIHVDLGLGSSSETVWTCDLSHDYITINAEYRS